MKRIRLGVIDAMWCRCLPILLCLFIAPACFSTGSSGSSSDTTSGGDNTSIPEKAAVLTTTGTFGAFMVNTEGEMLLPMVNRSSPTGPATSISGALWTDATGGSVTVFFDANGLPEKTVLGDFIFLFSNWNARAMTVDIAKVYGPTGYLQVYKNVTIGNDILDLLGSENLLSVEKATCFPACETDTQNLAQLLKLAGLGISVGACGVATTVSLGAMALPCAGAIVTTASLVIGDEEWLENLEGAGNILAAVEVFQCGLGNAESCVSTALEASSQILNGADQVLNDNVGEINDAELFLDDPGQPSGIIDPGTDPIPCTTSYQCSPGAYMPCYPEGVKQCTSSCTWSSCPNIDTPSVPDDGGSGGGSSSGETCYTAGNSCAACSFSACVTEDADNNCISARYRTSDGGSFVCAACSSCYAAAERAAQHCLSVCFGL